MPTPPILSIAPLDGRNLGQDFAGLDGWSMYHGQTVPKDYIPRGSQAHASSRW